MAATALPEGAVKGSVTPLASVFPAEEAEKAATRVEDDIASRRKELDRLRLFADDNANLINLVHRLPDELSHDIMVPFGKAAFFPGRLIHTNEFLVFLGEGYYADRTAKQTVEILKRRGKTLESQMESLRAMMDDLQAEANFFATTAIEAAEGLMEIREEYIEELHTEKKAELGISVGISKAGKAKMTDEEYAQIEARLDELEKEELAAECASSDAEDGSVEAGFKTFASQCPFDDGDLKVSLEEQLKESIKKSEGKEILLTTTTQSRSKDLKVRFGAKEDPPCIKSSEHTLEQSQAIQRSQVPAESKELVHEVPLAKLEAFTGSIIEHSHGLASNMSQSSTQASSPHPSKPVSRFKMQKGTR